MARIQAVAISIELLQEIMTEGWTVGGDDSSITCTKGLPEGAKFVRSGYSPEMRGAILYFEHESFPDVEIPWPPPLMDVEFQFSRPVSLELEQ